MAFAQGKEKLVLEDIWKKGLYRQDNIWGVNSMNDGLHFSMINFDSETASRNIEKYSYAEFEQVSTILSSKDVNNLAFSSYSFSADENKVLLPVNTESIYRHSTRSEYYIYDLAGEKLNKLSEGKQRLATFSPNANKIAFVRSNNLFVKDLTNGTETQITNDGEYNKIINGATDWVYEEEFSFDKGFAWNADGTKIAYYKFDETEVPVFSMDMFQNELYPSQYTFKYPKCGEKNANVEIWIYDLKSKQNTEAKIATQDEFYIPRIHWTKDANTLSVQRLNRHQNKLDFILVNANDGSANTIFTETDEAYVDIHDNLRFLSGGKYFIWTSEKSGYNHIYLYSLSGKEIRQITTGNWEVTSFYGYNEKKKTLYYQSAEESPLKRAVYSINIKGKSKKRISVNSGTNNAQFSNNFSYFINTFSDANTPNIITLRASNGRLIKELKNSSSLNDKLAKLDISQKEFISFTTKENVSLNGWMIKPTNFDPNKKYPVLMYLYGGPGSQQVTDGWGGTNLMWYQYLAQNGYIVACFDNRGTGARGRDFKKCTYKELGKLETEDQMQANRYLASLPYVDGSRIGIQGWSYGGFMSSNCLFKGNEIFKLAIAVAPVTNWKYYDSIYTERYMRTPQENNSGYEDNSPINHVDKLKGKYLLVHGSADDNVHYQNTMELINALVAANKDFDLAIYPDKNHGIYGGNNGNTRLHLFTKMSKFIFENL
jgi:dipeptidyl-peptidase-4